jgi:hypothetical protein
MVRGRWSTGVRVGVLAAVAIAGAACSSSTSASSAAPSSAKPTGVHVLVGTFELAPGTCPSATATPTGSWLQMVGKGDAVIKNSFGGCANPEYTPLSPGTKGGLTTGAFEPNPTPAFSGSNALADDIAKPVSFFGSNFAMSTQAVDPQTHDTVPAPSVTSHSGVLTGNLEAIDVAYNGAYFNQGSPKPGGTYPGTTKPVSGTIDCAGTYTLQWSSLIVGGAFNGYTGVWHLTGTFEPAGGKSLAGVLGC